MQGAGSCLALLPALSPVVLGGAGERQELEPARGGVRADGVQGKLDLGGARGRV